jgi:glutaredoxin
MKRIVLLTALLLVASAQAGDLYRWVDSAGKVHYGDAPPPAAEADEKRFYDAAGPDEDLPYATRRAKQNFPVTLYVAENCTDICERARELLIERGIPFDEKKLVTQKEIDAFKAASGGDSVPALGVGRTIVNGFEAGRWHGELDIAGYPKLAPYRPRPEAPAAADEKAAGGIAPSGSPGP